MRINSRVKSINKNGQIQAVGKIIALYEANYWLLYCTKYDPDFMWSKNYPNWKEKPVALVYFDMPQKVATLEEWVTDGINKGLSREECELSYEDCPVLSSTCFPIDDLKEVK